MERVKHRRLLEPIHLRTPIDLHPPELGDAGVIILPLTEKLMSYRPVFFFVFCFIYFFRAVYLCLLGFMLFSFKSMSVSAVSDLLGISLSILLL